MYKVDSKLILEVSRMSLESKAQNFLFDQMPDENLAGDFLLGLDLPEEGLEVVDEEPQEFKLEIPDEIEVEDQEEPLEVTLEFPGDLPGAPDSPVHEEEPELEVVDGDDDDAKDKKKSKDPKWDWESRGPQGFVVWVQERFDGVPKHSGYDSAGLERAISYLNRLDSEISKAMRLDLGGELDANSVEDIRSTIEEGLDRLEDRLDKVRSKRGKKRKKNAENEDMIRKEAQKITGVQGVVATVPLLILRIAKICINGTVSAGHDIEDTYNRLIKKFNLNDREQAETLELLDNMGYKLRQDRAFLAGEEIDPSSSDNFDWAANYRG